MSEEDRSRLYDWLCEQADKPLAEYLMSCLSPTPLPDLVTKEFFSAELSAQLARFATKDDLAKLDAKVTKLDTTVAFLVAQREEDCRSARVRHFWLAGIVLTAALPIWLDAFGVVG